MAKRNRQTLKKSFSKGQKPSERDFENLIDSTLNILDDGFSKSPESGIELSPLIGEKRVVMSVFRESGNPNPEWEISIGTAGELKICQFGKDNSIPAIVLHTDGSIEIGSERSNVILKGQLASPGRKGTYIEDSVPADGQWHDMSEDMEGVCALEVVAAAGRRHSGKHAVLVAMATHCFGARAKIKNIRSCYGMFGNKIKLRWVKHGLACRLQIKTIFNYGEDMQIHFQVSRLWDNPLMENI